MAASHHSDTQYYGKPVTSVPVTPYILPVGSGHGVRLGLAQIRVVVGELHDRVAPAVPAIDQPSAMLKDELLHGSGQRQRGSD